MSKVLAINVFKYIVCAECGESLYGDVRIGEIREHADNAYSFVCVGCAGVE